VIKGKRVFLTGGAGFIGTTVAGLLADDNEVVLYDNLHNDALSQTDLAAHPNVTFVQGDILDLEHMRGAAEGATHIVHMAAIAGVATVLKSPVRTMRVNLMGTANVAEVAHGLGDKLERMIDFSTSEVFGRHAYKVEETHETSGGQVGEARWSYAVSKLAGEYFLHAYFEEYGLPVAVVRPFNIYGPNQIGVGAIHHFVRHAIANEEITVHNDGAQIRAWCYMDDIAAAVIEILENPAAIGQSFNIGNPRSVCTTYDLALRIKRLAGSSSPIVFKPLEYSDVEIRIPDITRAREVLAWEPKVDLDEGLERTIEWYRAEAGSAAK
jgi:nucleoside-diphosphate-sugar epimerase